MAIKVKESFDEVCLEAKDDIRH